MERAIILSESDSLQPDDFPFPEQKKTGDSREPESVNLDEVEKYTILKALKNYQGNVSRAARALGLSRAALYRRMTRHGLS